MDLPRPLMDSALVEPSTRCTNPNGKVTASMRVGKAADYDFVLIQQSPQQRTISNTTDSIFTDLEPGIYELKAYSPTDSCGFFSNGQTITIEDNTTPPTLTAAQISPQTNCGSVPPNGHLRVTPSAPGTYSYTWYKGTITTGPLAEDVSNTADATGLGTDGNLSQLFTIVLVDDVTGCSVSDTVRLYEEVVYPEIDPTDVSTQSTNEMWQ